MASIAGFPSYDYNVNEFTVDLSANGFINLNSGNESSLRLTKGTNANDLANVVYPLTQKELTDLSNNKILKITFPSELLAKLFKLDSTLDTITVSGDICGISVAFNISKVTLTEYLSINDVVYDTNNNGRAIMSVRGNPSLAGQTMAQLSDDQGNWLQYTFTQEDLDAMNANLGALYNVTIPGVTLGSTYYAFFISGKNNIQKTLPVNMVTLPSVPEFISYSTKYVDNSFCDVSLNFVYPTTQQMGYDASFNVKLSYWASGANSKPKCEEVRLSNYTKKTDGSYTVNTKLMADKLYRLTPFYENTAGSSVMQPPILIQVSNKPIGVSSSTVLSTSVNGNNLTINSVPTTDASMNNYSFEFKLLNGAQVVATQTVLPKLGTGVGVNGPFASSDMSFNNVPYGNYTVSIQAFNDFGGSPIFKSLKVVNIVGSPSAPINLTTETTFDTKAPFVEQDYIQNIKIKWSKSQDTSNAPVSAFGVFAKGDASNNDLDNDYLGYVPVSVNDGTDNYSFDMSLNAVQSVKWADKTLVLYVASVYDMSLNYTNNNKTSGTYAENKSFVTGSNVKRTIAYSSPVANIQSQISSDKIVDLSYNQLVTSDNSTLVSINWKMIDVSNNLPMITYTIKNTNAENPITYASNLTASNFTFVGTLPTGSNGIIIIPSYRNQGVTGAVVPSTAKQFSIIVKEINPSTLKFPTPNPASFYKDVDGNIAGSLSIMVDLSNNLPTYPTAYRLVSLTCTAYNEYGEDCSFNTILAGSLPIPGKQVRFTLPISSNKPGIYTNKLTATFTDGSNNYYTESSSSPPTVVNTTLAFGAGPTLSSTDLSFNVVRGALPGMIEVYFIFNDGSISTRILDDFIAGTGNSVTKLYSGINIKGAVVILRSGEQSLVRLITAT